MAEIRHLANAPITEALIDLKVKFPAGFQPDHLFALKDKLKDRLPKIEERRHLEHKFGLNRQGQPIPPVTELKGLHGLFFRSADGLDVVQCRIDGYTFSRLKPYRDWEHLLRQAKKYWDIYCATVAPESISRVAVRYINRIQPPPPFDDFSKYFTAPLPVPPGRQRPISGMLTQVRMADEEHNVSVNIIQALEPNIQRDPATVILDIDVFKVHEYIVDDESAWSMLEILRRIKNELFFNSITEETVRLFE